MKCLMSDRVSEGRPAGNNPPRPWQAALITESFGIEGLHEGESAGGRSRAEDPLRNRTLWEMTEESTEREGYCVFDQMTSSLRFLFPGQREAMMMTSSIAITNHILYVP